MQTKLLSLRPMLCKTKKHKVGKKAFSFQFRISFFVCLSTILIEVNTMESILFRGGNIGDKQWPVAICAQG